MDIGLLLDSPILLVTGAAVFVGLLGVIFLVVRPGSATADGPRTTPAEAATQSVNAVTRTAIAASKAVVGSPERDAKITLGLDQAGMRLPANEWVLVRAVITVATAGVFLILLGWLGLVAGVLVGWIGTGLYRSMRADRRKNAFADQLPDALQLIIGSLRTGFSLPQALDSLVREAPNPIAEEFGRALAENRLGMDLSEALEGVVKRTQSDDLDWAVLAVRIQREVGGNLAEVLQTTVDTIRERGRLRRHVRSLSAEGRLSAWVLVMLPIGLGAFMFTFRRDYLAPLYTEPAGRMMLTVGVSLLISGIFWMWRTVKVEV